MKERLSEKVYQSLREDIFNARYSPNELIVERDVALRYGVSKVTASEALHRLCSEGHLTSHPRSGYTVTLLSPTDLEQIKRMRIALESLVIDILCAEATDYDVRSLYKLVESEYDDKVKFASINACFHLGMAHLTRDKYLISTLTSLIGAISRVETIISLSYYDEWQEYHRRIVDSILARDAEEAKRQLLLDLNQRTTTAAGQSLNNLRQQTN